MLHCPLFLVTPPERVSLLLQAQVSPSQLPLLPAAHVGGLQGAALQAKGGPRKVAAQTTSTSRGSLLGSAP